MRFEYRESNKVLGIVILVARSNSLIRIIISANNNNKNNKNTTPAS